jgi:hypothetical protein
MSSTRQWIVWWTDGVSRHYSGGPAHGPTIRVIVQNAREMAWEYDDLAEATAIADHIATADQINAGDVHVEAVD